MFLDINCRQEPDIKPIQASGVDLVEKEPQPRFIKINYGTRGAEYELKDTIVKPTYTKISKDTGGIKIITNERLLHDVNISLFDYD